MKENQKTKLKELFSNKNLVKCFFFALLSIFVFGRIVYFCGLQNVSSVFYDIIGRIAYFFLFISIYAAAITALILVSRFMLKLIRKISFYINSTDQFNP